jgi:hypothetical protein
MNSKSHLFTLIIILYLVYLSPAKAQVFSEVASEYGLADARNATCAVWLDYDNDGDFDLFITANNDTYAALYRNDDFIFKDIADSVAINFGHATSGTKLSVGDYDNDGDIDISASTDAAYTNSNLFRNDLAEQTFTRLSRFGYCGIMGDFDNDGDLDLYSPNQDYENNLFRNDGSDEFIKIEGALGTNDSRFSRMAAWADYDNDGDLDLYVVNGRYMRNTLYRNDFRESGSFTDVSEALGVGGSSYSDGACWGDYDNDGDLDLYVANSG